jgi:hypothetical protein
MRVILSGAKDLTLDVSDTQISLRGPSPFVWSLTSFGMTARLSMVLICPNRALNCLRDSVRLRVDLVEFTAFDEQANLWLSP